MAAEGRHKFPSTLGMAGEERHKSLLFFILNVCSIGSALALPMTPSEEGPCGSSEVGRGSRGRVCAPGPHSWSFNRNRFNTVQGVLAVHSSDLDKAHHRGYSSQDLTASDPSTVTVNAQACKPHFRICGSFRRQTGLNS